MGDERNFERVVRLDAASWNDVSLNMEETRLNTRILRVFLKIFTVLKSWVVGGWGVGTIAKEPVD
jgi:hypothetical protein